MENTQSDPEMPGRFDVFISYRRGGGASEARSIRAALQERGLRVFLDVDDLRSGYFDASLLKHIEDAPNFLIILSPNSLEHCGNEGDWLRREISCALTLKKNIIPVQLPGFQFPPELPEDICDLPRHQALDYSHIYFAAMISKISENLCLMSREPRHASSGPKKVTGEQKQGGTAAGAPSYMAKPPAKGAGKWAGIALLWLMALNCGLPSKDGTEPSRVCSLG